MTLNIVAIMREPERSTFALDRLARDHAGVAVHVAQDFAEAQPHLAQADVIITLGLHLGADAGATFTKAKRLKWVQSFGSGTDNIKGHIALASDVAVTNVHGIHGAQLAEAAFAGMLHFARCSSAFAHDQALRQWRRHVPSTLNGQTVGIFGLGAIANAIAPRCAAFGMRVIGISGTARDVSGFARVFSRNDLEAAVAELDYLILLTPHTPHTHHMVSSDVFAAMKPNAYLINLARGGVVDETALLVALDTGQIAGAALDVFETEPLPMEHPLWTHPKVMITPHTAGFHAGYADDAYAMISDNVGRYLAGGTAALINKV